MINGYQDYFAVAYALSGAEECCIHRLAGNIDDDLPNVEDDDLVKLVGPGPSGEFPVIAMAYNPTRASQWIGGVASNAEWITDQKHFKVDLAVSGKVFHIKGIQLYNNDQIEYPAGSGQMYDVSPGCIEYDSKNEISVCLGVFLS